jgi:hypothetical protein
MAPIEVTLNSYRYHFRRLTWQEEARLQFSKTEDQRKTIMARALVDVCGLPVTTEQAIVILQSIPDAVFWRIWVVYRGNLPEDRYYTSGGLYEAPDQMTYRQRIYDDGVAVEVAADVATAKLERQFGRDGVPEPSPQLRIRLEDAGIRWPQAFVCPRTAFTAAVRTRTRSSRKRIKVRAYCCSTVR